MTGLAGWLQAQWWQPAPTLAARALQPLSWLVGAFARLPQPEPPAGGVPVIVVGNLVAGGAGKTPTVIALVDWLREHGWTPGVVSRGYGRRTTGLRVADAHSTAADIGDEPLLMRRRCRVPVVVAADRLAALHALRAAAPQVDVVLSDDGLQHHALPRAVQLLLFDERGTGNGLLLPAGPLRAPLPARLPPRTLVLYSAGVVSTPLPGARAERALGGWLDLADWQRGAAPNADWSALRGRPLVAAAGIAAPQRFFEMLRALGLTLAESYALPDHHAFDTLPWPAATHEVIVTEKDAVKLDAQRLGATRVRVATLDLRLPLDLLHTLHTLLATERAPGALPPESQR
jgi:tetraacyldisaccharide 4'-kinase